VRGHSFDDDQVDVEFDSYDRPRRRRGRYDDDADGGSGSSSGGASVRRGRLTDLERDRLAAARVEAEDALEVPLGADRWSTWGQGQLGPEPWPSWVITEEGAVDTRLGVVKTGKEAEVHLVERVLPGTTRRVLLAEKRYRSADHRLFHRDAGYLEGRRVRESRVSRAITNRTEFGRKLIAEQWAAAEFAALCGLWEAGAPVPYPMERLGTDLLLEFIGDADGAAAPRLAQLRPDADSLDDLWEQLVDALAILARAGFTHGDLSPYNVLVHDGRVVLIDLPQVVDVVVNPRGVELLERDVRNVAGWFEARGLPHADARTLELLGRLKGEAGIEKY
jgi:RIO kinase 1